jgi:hypothetical protein
MIDKAGNMPSLPAVFPNRMARVLWLVRQAGAN